MARERKKCFVSLSFTAGLFLLLTSQAFADPNNGSESSATYSASPAVAVPKIVNGKDAELEQFPWAVSVGLREKKQYFGHFCGGSILDKSWILTAAHCFRGISSAPVIGILAGSIRLTEHGAFPHAAQRILIHEKFDFNLGAQGGADIALIKLSEPLSFSEPRIGNVEISTSENFNASGFEVMNREFPITGFGAVSSGGVTSAKLQFASVQSLTHSICNSESAYNGKVKADMICAGDTAGSPADRNDACDGDSGGGLVHEADDGKWYILGIVSWGGDPASGRKCGDTRMVGVYTKVSDFNEWIQNCILERTTCNSVVID